MTGRRRVWASSGHRTGLLGVVTLLAGALLLGASWVAVAPGAPPLYDGVGFPDEPYRFLPGSGSGATPPTQRAPTAASADIAVRAGRSVAANVSTREQGPQAAIYVADQGLAVAGGASHVTVTLTPVRPPFAPADGSIPGVAYQVAASGAGAVSVAPIPNAVTVLLRVPKATNAAVAVEVVSAGRWEQLDTFQTGADVYSASLPILSTVAAVIVDKPARATPYRGASPVPVARRGGPSAALLLAGGVLLALVLLIVGVRISRLRRDRLTGPATPPHLGAPPH